MHALGGKMWVYWYHETHPLEFLPRLTPSLTYNNPCHVTTPQFLDFILLVALRCPMFRGTAAPVVKLSNLMLLLNQSQGKHKISKRCRAKELVVFRVNPVFAMAASYTSAQQSASSADSPFSGQHGGNFGSNAGAGAHAHTASFNDSPAGAASSFGCDSAKSGEWQHMKSPTQCFSPTNGDIRISPTSKAFKPSTVPFFDVATQSVVQIRRKKPMAELRSKLSDSY